MFSSVLGETFTRSSGYKELFRRLETTFPDRRRVEAKSRNGPSCYASLSKALRAESGMGVLVLGNPTRPLSTAERQKLVDFIVDGGHLVVAAGDGGIKGSDVNDILRLFGISVNTDSVLRVMVHKYYHPKEVLIPDGIVNRAITKAFWEHQGTVHTSSSFVSQVASHHQRNAMSSWLWKHHWLQPCTVPWRCSTDVTKAVCSVWTPAVYTGKAAWWFLIYRILWPSRIHAGRRCFMNDLSMHTL